MDVISHSLSLLLPKIVLVLQHMKQEAAVILNNPRKSENYKNKNEIRKRKKKEDKLSFRLWALASLSLWLGKSSGEVKVLIKLKQEGEIQSFCFIV